MKQDRKQADPGRRDFLRGSVAAGASATIVAAVPGTALATTGEDTPAKPKENYRITRHIADYYKSTL
jgi:hypothetical protein